MPCLYSTVYTQLVFHRASQPPPGTGWRRRSSEEAVNLLLYLLRVVLSSTTCEQPRRGEGVDVIFVIGRCTQRPYCLDGLSGVFSFIRLVFSFWFVLIHPLRFARPACLRGAKRVFRRITRCASVPSEGSNFHCDVGRFAGAVVVFQFVTNSPPETGGVPRSGEGVDKPLLSSFFFLFSPHQFIT